MTSFIPCPSCGRHVRVSADACPFCVTALGTTSAPVRLAFALSLGLAISGCGGEEEGADTGVSATEGGTASSDPTGTSAGAVDPDQGGEDYGGFGDTFEPPPPGSTSSASDPFPGTDSGTDSGTGGESTTGAPDTGDTTMGDTGGTTEASPDPDAGGEDYAGPGTDTF